MAAINIRRDVKDSFYRYKMPKLISKVEGRGNGIRTVVPNMSDIAKSLNRPPACNNIFYSFLTPYLIDPTKFFGCELGAQTKLDDKNDRYIVNGAHDADKLQDLLDVFINKFVLCGECQNPETDLIVSGKDSIIRNCKACGKRTVVDMRHKLTTFILKNPPPPPAAYGKKSSATSAKKEANGNGGSNEASAEEKEDDGDELTKKIQAEAATLVTKLKDDDDDDWAEDTSKEAQEARLRELEGSVQKKLILGEGDDDEDDEDGSGGNKYEKFGIWLEESDKTSISDKEVVDKATELGIFGKHRAVQVLVQVLFDEKIMEQLPKRLGLLHKVELYLQSLISWVVCYQRKGAEIVVGGIGAIHGVDLSQGANQNTVCFEEFI